MAISTVIAMAEASPIPIKVVDHYRVSPKSRLSSPTSANLSAFDIPWSFIFSDGSHQPQQILFYQFPNSYNNDMIHHQVIPSLKSSLSLALDKFYPYASKLVLPPHPETPRIVYTDGDSVPFTVAESMMDFSELVGDQIKDVKLLHPLIPNLSPQIQSSEDDNAGTWIIPDLLAIQVTLFPESGGLCIGIHVNHAVSDAIALMYFLKSWASICGSLKEAEVSSSVGVIPFLNRDVIEDATGLQTIQFWKEWSQTFPIKPPNNNNSSSFSTSHDEVVRATFIFSKTNINRLKHWIILNQQQQPTLSNYNISSFAAVCAFAWVCFLKSKQELDNGVVVDDNKEEECFFIFTADVRNRLKPLIPETFFGNCVVPRFVRIKKNDLLGKQGIIYAAKAISDKVKELDDDSAVASAVETWLFESRASRPKRVLSVAGSPRMAIYDMDFGWGKPKKFEMVHISARGSITLLQTRDDVEQGGVEIGVALQRDAMDKFTTLFQELCTDSALHAGRPAKL